MLTEVWYAQRVNTQEKQNKIVVPRGKGKVKRNDDHYHRLTKIHFSEIIPGNLLCIMVPRVA